MQMDYILKNGELLTDKTCEDFIQDRILIHKKFGKLDVFNYNDFDTFYNEIITRFKNKHPELLKGNKAASFLSTIKNIAQKYYNKIKQEE